MSISADEKRKQGPRRKRSWTLISAKMSSAVAHWSGAPSMQTSPASKVAGAAEPSELRPLEVLFISLGVPSLSVAASARFANGPARDLLVGPASPRTPHGSLGSRKGAGEDSFEDAAEEDTEEPRNAVEAEHVDALGLQLRFDMKGAGSALRAQLRPRAAAPPMPTTG